MNIARFCYRAAWNADAV